MLTELNKPVRFLKGIGQKKSERLYRLGIETVEDMIYDFPRDYENRRNKKTITQAEEHDQVLILGKVIQKQKGQYKRNKKILFKLLVEDEIGVLEIVFFNATYYDKKFEVGKKYFFYGKITLSFGKKQMIHPDIYEQGETIPAWVAIYPLTEGMGQKERQKIQKICEPFMNEIDEYMPQKTIERNRLCDIKYALKHIHFPENGTAIKEAKYRLIFEELLLLQTGLFLIKEQIKEGKKGLSFSKQDSVDDFIKSLPFNLTGAQKRVIDEIFIDMTSSKVMNRLVQGDVGSGKTVVAAAAIYKAVVNGYQSALMAPTEILAKQHYKTFKDFYESFDIQIAFLAGSTPKKQKTEIISDLEMGKIDLIIGTHAVIQEHVKFKKLGLVITDEQHRFGVKQRTALSQKGQNPDVLVMTATPIPRTLGLILYGDLDISIIDELPPGRKEIKTYAINENKRRAAYDFIMKEIKGGRQAYIVTPLIEESESLNARSVTDVYEEVMQNYPHCKTALLHGNLKQCEKDEIMNHFSQGNIEILVSTVVIEVGVNVPNSTIMLIESSQRFGLAQLHQLRGRVGRGCHQSYCILVCSSKSKIAIERTKVLEKTNDGFLIAEKDLMNRGPGDFFGTKQHGLPQLKIANLFQHIKILKQAQEETKKLLKEDPSLKKSEHKNLKNKVVKLFKKNKNISL